MITDDIRKELFELKDEKYGEFQSKLTPTVDRAFVIGVRTPELRKLAKELGKREDIGEFLGSLPHEYFEEDQLHAFIVAGIKSFDECLAAVEAFLPFVDNWATCDQMSPKVFGKNKPELLSAVKRWIVSKHCYTVRFGIKMLMDNFLDEDFKPAYPELVAGVKSEEYYVNMMAAWYFATALAKQYEAVLPFLEGRRLPAWTHRKTIQKAVESYRISPEHKDHIRTLR